jgi:hypothetical protein
MTRPFRNLDNCAPNVTARLNKHQDRSGHDPFRMRMSAKIRRLSLNVEEE